MGVLHFYPGQKRMLWVVKGRPKLTAEAWGGEEVPDGVKFGQMRPHRTTPGRFVVHSYGPYRTKTWAMARIRWGTPLKVEGTGVLKYVLYQTGTGHRSWRRVDSLIPSASFNQLQTWYRMLYGDSGLYDPDRDGIPDRWIFNEFGPKAVRYFKDLNNDGVLDGDEHLMGELIHTVPINEAELARGVPIKYTISHGCIHVSPPDRDRLVSAGAFKKGTAFIVHGYEARVPVTPRAELPQAPEAPPTETRAARPVRDRTLLEVLVPDEAASATIADAPAAALELEEAAPVAAVDEQPEEPATEPEPEAPAPELPVDVVVALDTIDLQLIDADGNPVAGQKLSILLADGSAREAVTDDDGAVLIAEVPGGDFVVSIVD